VNLALTAHIVRREDFSFIDFGMPDVDERKFREIPFPTIESPLFGRIDLEKNNVRFELLKDECVKESLPTVQTADALVISAPTEEFRKFALEHAEDREAFSEHSSLSRTQ
jgi:hypothetical protein